MLSWLDDVRFSAAKLCSALTVEGGGGGGAQ
jgi:hypothetical protein